MHRFKAVRALTLVVTALLVLGPAAIARADGGSGGAEGGGQETSLVGVVESLPSGGLIGDWVVSGTTVHVTQSTELEDAAGVTVGATVEVEGTVASDGSIDASSVAMNESSGDDSYGNVDLQGVVQSMPASGLVGDWVVSGVTVHVTDSTEIDSGDGSLAVGSFVEVKGIGQSDGSVTALQLEVQSDQGSGDATESLTGSVLTARHGDVLSVAHHRVLITGSTRIVRHGHRLVRGSRVTVTGHLRHHRLVATKIVIR